MFSRELKGLLLILGLLTLWRFSVLISSGLTLYIDEAYYWFWSQHLAWGYFSKPPMIASVIASTTAVCGDSTFCVRSGSLIFYPLTSLVVYALGRYLFNRRIGLFSALVFITLPAVSLSSLIISTDVLLFFYWALALYAFVRALDDNTWRWWLLLALAGGLGLLTKYTMGIFALSVGLYLILSARWDVFRNPRLWLAAALAFLIWLPHLLWNTQHNFITVSHTSDISNLEQAGLHWNELSEFLGGQFAVFGLLFFALFLGILFMSKQKHKRLLLCFSLPFLAIITLQALFGRANANWAAPTYIAASIFITAYLLQRQTRLLSVLFVIGLSLNLLFAVGIYYYQDFFRLTQTSFNAKSDIYKRLRGWDQLGEQLNALKKEYPNIPIMSQERTILAQMAYYAHPITIETWNPKANIRHQFDLQSDISAQIGQDYLFISKHPLPENMHSSFSDIKPIAHLAVPLYKDYTLDYRVYHLQSFKGYF